MAIAGEDIQECGKLAAPPAGKITGEVIIEQRSSEDCVPRASPRNHAIKDCPWELGITVAVPACHQHRDRQQNQEQLAQNKIDEAKNQRIANAARSRQMCTRSGPDRLAD